MNTTDGVTASQAPSKAEREVCWGARDRYWECLDKAGAVKVDDNLCTELRKVFETGCSKTWVKYFDRRFGYTRFKQNAKAEVITDDNVSE